MKITIEVVPTKDRQPTRSGEYLIWYEWGSKTVMEWNEEHHGWNLLEDGDRSFEAWPAFWAEIPRIKEVEEVVERKYMEVMNG